MEVICTNDSFAAPVLAFYTEYLRDHPQPAQNQHRLTPHRGNLFGYDLFAALPRPCFNDK